MTTPGCTFFKHRFQRGQNPAGGLKQRLARSHQIEVVIGPHLEHAQNLIEHLTVLARHAYLH